MASKIDDLIKRSSTVDTEDEEDFEIEDIDSEDIDDDDLRAALAAIKKAKAAAGGSKKTKKSSKRRRSIEELKSLSREDDDEEEEIDFEIELDEVFLQPDGAEYKPRFIVEDELLDVVALLKAREDKMNTLMYGYPGTGKTSLILSVFKDDVISVEGAEDTTVADFVGSYVPGEIEGQYNWLDGPLVRAMKEGKILFIDDFTLIRPAVLGRVYPAMDGRRAIHVTEHEGERVEAAEGFMVIAAHNPGTIGAVLSEALKSRFSISFEVKTDYTLASKEYKLPAKFKRVCQKIAQNRSSHIVTWAPEMRDLRDYANVKKSFGSSFALDNLIRKAPDGEQKVIAGLFSEAGYTTSYDEE